MDDFREHIRRAITICGSQKALADKIGRSQPGISWLLNGAKNISGDDAVKIEKATDGQVRRWELRPDLFDPPKDQIEKSEAAA